MLYTIGYGNRHWSNLRQLLGDRRCELLIDVRSQPFSAFNPSFNKAALAQLCQQAGISYQHLAALGGKPTAPQLLNAYGQPDYRRISESPAFQQGLSELVRLKQQGVYTCLMCSESKPEQCHRTLLIGEALARLGMAPTHINEFGEDTSHSAIMQKISGGQGDLFA